MPSIVFAHGLESKPWGRKSRALVDAGHTVIAPDCQGRDLLERVALLEAAIRSAATGAPLVVGSSFGGLAAVLAVASLRRANVAIRGLVLCAPAFSRVRSADLPAALDVPTTIVHGRNDTVIPIECSRAYVQSHPEAELVEVDDTHALAASIATLLATVARHLT